MKRRSFLSGLLGLAPAVAVGKALANVEPEVIEEVMPKESGLSEIAKSSWEEGRQCAEIETVALKDYEPIHGSDYYLDIPSKRKQLNCYIEDFRIADGSPAFGIFKTEQYLEHRAIALNYLVLAPWKNDVTTVADDRSFSIKWRRVPC